MSLLELLVSSNEGRAAFQILVLEWFDVRAVAVLQRVCRGLKTRVTPLKTSPKWISKVEAHIARERKLATDDAAMAATGKARPADRYDLAFRKGGLLRAIGSGRRLPIERNAPALPAPLAPAPVAVSPAVLAISPDARNAPSAPSATAMQGPAHARLRLKLQARSARNPDKR